MNSYILSRQWFAFAFENPSKVRPAHGAIYFWLIELANKLGWPPEFGNPANQSMLACGISSYKTYKKAFDELAEFGFVNVVRPSTNQYQSCIIALVIFTEANTNALTRSVLYHLPNQLPDQCRSKDQITSHINKPITLNQETSNLKPQTVSTSENEAIDFIEKAKIEAGNTSLAAKEKKASHTGGAARIEPDLHFPFDTENFRHMWSLWNDHRKSIRKPYKSITSEQAALKQLSCFDEDYAIGLIERSIAGGYQGLVFDDTKEKYQKQLNNYQNGRNNQGNGNRLDVEEAVRLSRMLA